MPIPQEVKKLIFSFFDSHQLTVTAQVCKEWRALSEADIFKKRCDSILQRYEKLKELKPTVFLKHLDNAYNEILTLAKKYPKKLTEEELNKISSTKEILLIAAVNQLDKLYSEIKKLVDELPPVGNDSISENEIKQTGVVLEKIDYNPKQRYDQMMAIYIKAKDKWMKIAGELGIQLSDDGYVCKIKPKLN